MTIVVKITDKFPKSCDHCPLFVDDEVGRTAYCSMNAEYTEEEIQNEEDGSLNMYYHGCLRNRPNSCPLREVTLSEEPIVKN